MNDVFSTWCHAARGLSFHPTRPWILAGLETGDIELWDYDNRSLQHTFRGHIGPVRSVHFHISKTLFVSGGDDRKILIWNHKVLKCLFNLPGHGGQINSVQFHHEFPWIISASSDQTFRIWDWLTRKCIYKFNHHSKSVTNACFHPIKPLILSASMDQKICVWDIRSFPDNPINHRKDASWCSKILRCLGAFVAPRELSFHFAGIVHATFHPTLPLICSAIADGAVEIWLRTLEKWERRPVMSCNKEVSCVVFHPKQNIIVASGGSYIIVGTEETPYRRAFRCDMKNIHVLASHRNKNLVAAGHSDGIVIFKLGREFPVFSLNNNYLYYIRGHFLRALNLSTRKDTQLIRVLEPGTSYVYQPPKVMSCSCTKTAVVICQEGDEGSYKVFNISEGLGNITYEETSGNGISAVFVTEGKIAVLEKKSDYLLVRKLNNEPFAVIALPTMVDGIFYAGMWRVLCRSTDRVFIWDFSLCSIVADLKGIPYMKRVIWKNDMKYVALLGKHSIIIANKDLQKKCEIREVSNVKSGVWWDYKEAFVYTTLKHLKLCSVNGEAKIVKSLNVPLYPATMDGSEVCALDRDANLRNIDLSFDENQ